jgi:hypothetical protein
MENTLKHRFGKVSVVMKAFAKCSQDKKSAPRGWEAFERVFGGKERMPC